MRNSKVLNVFIWGRPQHYVISLENTDENYYLITRLSFLIWLSNNNRRKYKNGYYDNALTYYIAVFFTVPVQHVLMLYF